MNLLNKLRTKGWYWDVLCFIWCALLFLAFMMICISADAQKPNDNYYIYKPSHNLAGWTGVLAVPVAMTTATIRDIQWKSKYGNRDPYMKGEKLYTYNKLMNSNNNILFTGIITSASFLLLQVYVNTRIRKKKSKSHYVCERYY